MNSELQIRPFRPADEETVISIWRICNLLVAPHNQPARDIARKLAHSPELFLVGEFGDRIAATCMAGYEGHRGWINYLAVHPDFQRRGFAAAIMAHAERLLRDRRCLKINLQIRETNTQVIDFYRSIGFSIDPVISMGKKLEAGQPC
ncbi:MAG TPA: GNAT family acetyltransferase [Chthoniobacterales bacterium]